MGNKSSNYTPNDSFNPEQWEEVSLSDQEKQYDGAYKKLKHRITNEIIQKYQVAFNDQEDYKDYMASFNWRLNEESIVNTKFLRQKHVKDLCSTTYMADVYIQNIQMRLSEVTDIPYPENLYVLYSTLDGYSKIYHFLGYMRPKQSLICVDNDGYVRVWINSDLSKNYPGQDDVIETKDKMSESMMVNQIINMVSQNTDHESEPISVPQFFRNKNKLHPTFQQAKLLISQYSRQYKTPIPQCFQSVLQMIHHDQFGLDDQNQNQIDSAAFREEIRPQSKVYLPRKPINEVYHEDQHHPLRYQIGQNQNPLLAHRQYLSPYQGIVGNSHQEPRFHNQTHQQTDHRHEPHQVFTTHSPRHNRHRQPIFSSHLAQPHNIEHRHSDHRANIFINTRPPRAVSQPGPPVTHLHVSSLPIKREQFRNRTLSDRYNYAQSYPHPQIFNSHLSQHKNTHEITMRSQFRPSTAYHFQRASAKPRPQIQINFMNNINENRRNLLGSDIRPVSNYMYHQQTAPSRGVPVPVARTNFVKFVHGNNFVDPIHVRRVETVPRRTTARDSNRQNRRIETQYETQHDAIQERDRVHNINSHTGHNTPSAENLIQRARATETRQETPQNFKDIQRFIRQNQPTVWEFQRGSNPRDEENFQQKSTKEASRHERNSQQHHQQATNRQRELQKSRQRQIEKSRQRQLEKSRQNRQNRESRQNRQNKQMRQRQMEKSRQIRQIRQKELQRSRQTRQRQPEKSRERQKQPKQLEWADQLQRSREKQMQKVASYDFEQRKLYYTSTTEQIIDPQIAADLALYTNLGEL